MRKISVLSIASPYSGGVYQYTLSLLEALRLSKKYEYVQIRHPDFPKILEKDIVVNIQKSSILLKIRRLIHTYTNFALGNLTPNMSFNLLDIDLIISPIITLLPFHMKKPFTVTIHDFQHEYYPEFFTLKERIIRKIIYKTAEKANLVICESKFVKKDIIKFLKVSENKIKVIPSPPPSYINNHSLNDTALKKVKEKYNLPDQFAFYPAHFWYHKNHVNLIKAIRLLKDKYGEVVFLVLVGSKKNNFENTMNEIQRFNLQQQVKYLGYVPDEDMPYLYKLAIVLVMPTLFESVSIPIWEAFYLGCPVVSSNVCALPEQVGNAGLLFDPTNIEDMAEKIYRIWTDENLRHELIRKGYERVKSLTLENYAKQWENVIEEALNKT